MQIERLLPSQRPELVDRSKLVGVFGMDRGHKPVDDTSIEYGMYLVASIRTGHHWGCTRHQMRGGDRECFEQCAGTDNA